MTTDRTLLITGATGSVSGALLGALAGSDYRIRALARDQAKAEPLRATGVEVAVGDLDEPESLTAAFEGVQELWLLVPNGPRASENSMNAVWAARNAGVERVVRLSAVGAALDAPTRSGRLHGLSDHELAGSGMRWTVLRPHWFMQNLLNEAGDVATQGAFSLNVDQARLAMIDVRDIAEFAARVLTDGERHDGRIYTPTGPESISFAEVAQRFTQALGKPVQYLPVSDDVTRKTLLGYGVSPWIVGMLVDYAQAYAAGWGDFTTTDFTDVVGHPPRRLDDFLRDHVAAFR